MPGNLAEWTRTTYRSYPYAPDDGRDDAPAQGRKVVRGANPFAAPGSNRDTYRLSYPWWQGVWDVGFRITCADEDPAPEEVAATTK